MFDYTEWIESIGHTIPSSVLCRFISYFSKANLNEYFHILLENEEKLLLDIEFHESMRNVSLIVDLYLRCTRRALIDEILLQNYILHLLSYGATIFSSDLDVFYSLSVRKESEFLDILLSMDLQRSNLRQQKVTFMYFRYTLFPDLDDFFTLLLDSYEKCDIEDIRDAIRRISKLFAIKTATKKYYEDNFPTDEEVNSILQVATCFPSLQQLARDASRIALCDMYNIHNVSQFYNVTHNLDISKFMKSLLTYRQVIYK